MKFLRNTEIETPGRIAWRKFRTQKLAVISVTFIVLLALLVTVGPYFTPDRSPNADEQFPELALAPLGTRVDVLRVPQGDAYILRPFSSISLINNEVVIRFQSPVDTSFSSMYRFPQAVFKNSNTTVEAIVGAYGEVRFFGLGADRLGRDVWSRLVRGGRVSLLIGLGAVALSLSIGLVIGAVSGYFGGAVDAFCMWLMNVVWSIPTLLLVIAITIVMGKGLVPVFLAVGLTMWVDVARLVRGQVMALRKRAFVEAGEALGFTHGRIIRVHIIPNIWGPVLVMLASNFAAAILIESGMSFLGFGVQPPTPTWGSMIESNRQFLITEHAHLTLLPGIAIMLLVLAFTLAGDGLRHAIDERADA